MSDVKQYLFRVHFGSIPGNGTGNFPGSIDPVQYRYYPKRLDYIDYLCSLPASTINLSRVASQLVDAYLTLKVGTYCHFVAVFQLSPEYPASYNTPVTFYHPWLDKRISPENLYLGNKPWFSSRYDIGELFSASAGGTDLDTRWALRTYDLDDRDYPNPNWPSQINPYFVLSIARAMDVGRCSHEFVKLALTANDFWLTVDNTLKLNIDGAAYRFRFPMYRRAIQGIPYQHSGYHLQDDGSVKLGRVALSTRVCNGVSDMMQQRRQFQRTPWAVGLLLHLWTKTVDTMHTLLHVNDQKGMPFLSTTPEFSGNVAVGARFSYREVPLHLIRSQVPTMCGFLNAVGVAYGNNTLICPTYNRTEFNKKVDYDMLLERFGSYQGKRNYVYLKSNLEHLLIVQRMVDTVYSLMKVMSDYDVYIESWTRKFWNPNSVEIQRQRWSDYAKIQGWLASKWNGVMGDTYAFTGLLQLWQLTFKPNIPSRGKGPEEVLRRSDPYAFAREFRDWFDLPKPVSGSVRRVPEYMGRRFPTMAPFRMWSLSGLDNEYTKAQADADNELNRAKLADALEAKRLQDIADKAEADARALQEVENMKQAIANKSGPNPNDPWDWRNWSSWDFWATERNAKDQAEYNRFANRVPTESELVHGLGEGLNRTPVGPKEPPPGFDGAWDAAQDPGTYSNPRPWVIVGKLLIAVGKDAAQNYIVETTQNTIGIPKNEDPLEDKTYQPRQLMPNFTPDGDMPYYG